MNMTRAGRRACLTSLALWVTVDASGGAAADLGWAAELSGVWSGVYTTAELDGWRVADFYCAVGCSAATYQRLHALLADPANDAVDFDALVARAEAETPALAALLTPEALARYGAFERGNDPSIRCEPKGLARQVVNPLPLEFTVYPDRLVIRYEQWQAERTIWLDAERDAEPATTLLGSSVGRFEGDVLIVDSAGIAENILTIDGAPHSAALRTTERYSLTDDATRLELTLTLEDPAMFREPIVMTKAWLKTPAEQILEERCEIISGKP